MPTAEKARTIEQAKEWYGKSVGVVFTDYRGMKVKEIQALRRDLRSKGGEIHVLKNTLFRLAAGDDTANMPEALHNGTTAVTFVFENEAAVAKSLLDYARTNKKLVVKGGFFGGKAFTAKQVEALSELPPRDVLIAQLIGTIAAPISNLVTVIEALYADPIRVIGAVADKAAEGSPIPAAAAAEETASAPAPAAEEAPAAEDEAASTPEGSAEEPASEEAPAADIPAEEPVETPAEPDSTEAEGA
jgi:large subunit ribosomal protein L10